LGAAVRSWAEPDRTEFLAERRGLLKSIVRELRPHQWSKNVLIFVPLLTAHVMRNLHYLLPAMLAFVCFCLTASGVYALNDLLDLPSDRRHTRKRKRPIASGELPIPAALALVVVLFGTASALCLLLPWQFAVLLLGYLVLTTAYSMVLKRKLMVDVLCLAALYTARILAGGLATGIPISPWLMAFSTFFFLSLAFAKRYTELESLVHTTEKVPGRGYWAADLELIRVLGPVSGYLCVLVFCLYISKSDEVARFYAHPDVLWLTCPILLYWISRLWFLAHRGHLPHDPVVFALTDTISYICGGLMLAILASASFKGL
jgi:4-hydroxybenzoate polyprenyltransferase